MNIQRERERLLNVLCDNEQSLRIEKDILNNQLTKVNGIRLKISRVKSKLYDLDQLKLF